MPRGAGPEAETGRPRVAHPAADAAVPPVDPVFEPPFEPPFEQLSEKTEEVLEVVEQIPPGAVLTYGDVAEIVGGRGARFVGNVMSRYSSELPWWRVVRAGGWPPRGLEHRARQHYRDEGTPMVRGTLDGLRVDLERARWPGPGTADPTP